MSKCQICEKHKMDVNPIFEDEDWMITHGPISSQILGYLYIEPKRHVENWTDFTDNELSKVGPLIKGLEKAMKQILDIDRVYVVTISEAVRHLHFHIIPRAAEGVVKGLDLIEQATQQKVKGQTNLTEEQYVHFQENLRNLFHEIHKH
jgi:diadenosine tetraphosphate (Ap4A) HIT family hydrolase